MHEIGIAQNVLDMAIQSAQASGARQIHEVRIRVGTMTGVVAESLQFAFEALREGTIAAAAGLKIEPVSAACWCAQCQAEFPAEDWRYECPQCHRLSSELRRGTELEMASVEIS